MIEKIRIPQDNDPVPNTALDYLVELLIENRRKLNEIIDWINDEQEAEAKK